MRGVKHTFAGLISNLLNWYFEATIQLLKIKAVSAYVKAVAVTRLLFIGIILLKSLFGLMFAGFILAHIGLLLYLPFSLQSKSLVLLILGFLYLLIPIIILFAISSQRVWMKYSRASELVRKIVNENS